MHTNQFHGMTHRNIFLNKSIILFYTFDLRQGSNFMVLCFHNPHAQIHRQGLSCSLYAQPQGQAQENYQRYTLKDNPG